MTIKPAAFANGANDARCGIDFIGVTCVFICHDGQGHLLMHKRSKHCRDEQGRWEFGGSAQEFGETMEHTVEREVWEEYGAKTKDLHFIGAQDNLRKLDDGTPTHWVSVIYAVLIDHAEATNHEPYKSDEIGLFTLGTLPSPLHSQIEHNVMKAVAAAGDILRPTA